MVLAAGLGTRLGTLTEGTPKCLIEVGGKAMIAHVMERLKLAGISEVIINLHYRGRQIREYLRANNFFDLKVTFSEEKVLLGTGGGLKNVEGFFKGDEDFLLHNSDVYSDFDLNKLINFHKLNSPLATLAVIDRETTRPLFFDSKGQLSGWENTKDGTGESFGGEVDAQAYGFSGIQVINPKIFSYMKEDKGSFSTMRIFMRAAKAGEKILAYRMDDAYWIDMGTPEKLRELQTLLGGKLEHH